MKWNPKRGKMTPSARPYKDEDHPVHEHKDTVRQFVRSSLPIGWKLDAPCVVGAVYVFPRLKGAPKKLKARTVKATKPDCDNLNKAIWDALKDVTWKDDGQVVAEFAIKLMAAPHEDPHTVLVFDQRPDSALRSLWAAVVPDAVSGAILNRR